MNLARPTLTPYMPAMSGQTLYDKIWDAHLVSTDANGEAILYVDLHLIHEVTTPQAFAGLRAAHRRGPPSRPHPGGGRSQHPDRRPGPRRGRRRRSGGAPAVADAGTQRRRTPHRVPTDGRSAQRHRPRRRPRTGPHAAGHDDRLRRFPHLDPRRVRGPGPGHRHLGGRACPGHPDPAPVQVAEHARDLHRRPRPRGRRQGLCARADRPDRDQRRHGLCDRIRGRG